MVVVSRSPEETFRLGEKIGRACRGGEVIGLAGPLGAGKTCFVRGLASGLAIDPELVYSPSFTLVAEYPGPLPLHHVDLFRLGEPVTSEEAEEIGLRETWDPGGVTAIEWASKWVAERSQFSLWVEFDLEADDVRRIRLSAFDRRGERLLSSLGE